MRQLLIRADDLGYSYAVNLGIARAVHEGLVRSVGLMPNMPEASRGWELMHGTDIAIGQHTNLCLGVPCADPQLIPSLLDERGQLKSSRAYRAAFAAGEEFAAYDELVIEIEAQLERFRAVVGKDPDYFEAHAVESGTLFAAIHDVAVRNGLREQPIPEGFDPRIAVRVGNTMARMIGPDMDDTAVYDPQGAVKEVVESMGDGETVVLVFHPGYLDNFILRTSSLTTNRTVSVDALIDSELRAWLVARDGLALVDYRDL